jgi:hypothetical protein
MLVLFASEACSLMVWSSFYSSQVMATLSAICHRRPSFIRALRHGAHSDGSYWARYLKLQVRIVGDDHELRIAQPSEDGVIGPL